MFKMQTTVMVSSYGFDFWYDVEHMFRIVNK
jgi:hypothetical protein